MAEETITTEETHPEAQSDEEMLGVLDGILGPDEDGDETPLTEEKPKEDKKPARERGPDGKFAKKETAEAKEPEPEAEPKETPQPAVPEGVNPVDYATAIQALHRDGVPPSVIESMKPAELVQWGKKRSETQKEVDGFASRIAELEKRPEAPTETPEAPSIDLDDAVKPFVEQYGEESAEPLKAFGKALHEQAFQAATAKLAEQSSQLQAIQDQLLNQAREAAREGLKKQYKLDDPSRWQQVMDRRAQDSFPYTSEADALRASCQVLFSDELLAEAQAKKADTNQARANGQPTTTSKGSPPPSDANLTPEQKFAKNEREILEAILDGDDARVKALTDEGDKMRRKHAMALVG
jgi:hypothetical protein